MWTAVDHFKQGILRWVLGDHSAKTFAPLWATVEAWQCYFYVTDSEAVATKGASGWSVYPGFIPEGDQIVSKTYMKRVEGENTRLRHYLARLQTFLTSLPQDFVLLEVRGNAETLNSVANSLSQVPGCSDSSMIHCIIQQRQKSQCDRNLVDSSLKFLGFVD